MRGSFNGLDTVQIMEDSIRVDDGVIVDGKKTFLANVTMFRNMNVTTLQTIPFNEFLEHVVLRNMPSNITHNIVVTGQVTSPTVKTETLFLQVRVLWVL